MAIQNKAIDPALIVKPTDVIGQAAKSATTAAGTLKVDIKPVKQLESPSAVIPAQSSANDNNSAASKFREQHDQYLAKVESNYVNNLSANKIAADAALADAQKVLDSVADIKTSGIKNNVQNFAKTAEQMNAVAAPVKTEQQSANLPLTVIAAEAGNAIAQAGRVPGGIAQGALKIAAAPGLALEAVNQKDANTYTQAQSVFSELRNTSPYLTQAELIEARDTGLITAEQYDETLDFWRVNGSPLDNPDVYRQIRADKQNVEVSKPITDFTKKINQKIENVTDSFVPAPSNPVSEFAAKGFDALGEAIPNMALSVATGGTMLGGNALSYAAAGLSGFSNEMVEGSGDFNKAALSGAIEAGTELIGGQTFNKTAGMVDGKLLSKTVDSIGEGAEEVLAGITNAVIIGDDYTLSDALYDAALGTFVGGVAHVGTTAVNAAKNEIGTIKTISDIESGKTGGAIGGLAESVKIAEADPDTYGDIARILAAPAEQSVFDTGALRTYVENAMAESGRNDIKVPSNIEKIDAENLGQYNSLSESGLRNAASVLEAAQAEGLSPSQSGRILNAMLKTNTVLYNRLADVGGSPINANNTVQIEKGVDYSRQSPSKGTADNYAVVDAQGRTAETSENDIGLNIFRGISSEWVIPTLNKGEFAVPNPKSSAGTETGSESLFGTKPGAMLGQGLYLTSMPSKADQYTSGVENEISMTGRDTTGIMKYSPLIGGKTFVNESALNQAESGITNDIVRRGTVGDETSLADFINSSTGNSEAAAIYSRVGNDYTEIVRPNTAKTQIESLYVPLNAINADTDTSTANTINEAAGINNELAAELGIQQAINSTTDTESQIGNDDINLLLDNNIGTNLEVGNVAAHAESGRESALTATEESVFTNYISDAEITLPKPITESAAATDVKTNDNQMISESISQSITQTANAEMPAITTPLNELNQGKSLAGISDNPAAVSKKFQSPETKANNITSTVEQIANNELSKTSPANLTPAESLPERTHINLAESNPEANVKENQSMQENERPSGEKSAAEIWTPVQFMRESIENKMQQKRPPGTEPGRTVIDAGPGATGQVYETASYNSTFGGLASY